MLSINQYLTAAVISQLPDEIETPGNNKVLIYAPGYTDSHDECDEGQDPPCGRQNAISDHANNRLGSAAYMDFNITRLHDDAASLDVVKSWGNYGAIFIHTHGAYTTAWINKYPILVTGTEQTDANDEKYKYDLRMRRLAVTGSGHYAFFPSFISKHSNSMNNTFTGVTALKSEIVAFEKYWCQRLQYISIRFFFFFRAFRAFVVRFFFDFTLHRCRSERIAWCTNQTGKVSANSTGIKREQPTSTGPLGV